MASSYTSRIRLEKQGSGENANNWGDRLNANVIDLVDAAVAGVTVVDVDGQGGSGVTLTTNDGSPDQARSLGLRMTGALSADVTVNYSTAPEKIYFVNNETTGGNNVIMDNGSTKVTVGRGPALIATNGSNGYAIRDFEPGTRIAFNQNSAPLGWTVITSASHAGAALRIVNAATSGAQVGGSNEFTSVFNTATNISIQGSTASSTLSGSTASHTLTLSQIPSHSHTISLFDSSSPDFSPRKVAATDDIGDPRGTTTSEVAGGSGGHSHSLSGLGSHSHTVSLTDSFNFNVKYVNFIVCEKD